MPSSKIQTFFSRLCSSLILWLLIAGTVWSANIWLIITLITLLGVAGSFEMIKMTTKTPYQVSKWYAPVLTLLFFTFVILGVITRDPETIILSYSLGSVVIFVLAFLPALFRPIEQGVSLSKAMYTLVTPMYTGVMFSFLILITYSQSGKEVPFIVWLIVTTKTTDMGGYVIGSLIGKHKFSPHVSPGKTWQGIIGSLFVACGFSWLVVYCYGDTLSFLSSYTTLISCSVIVSIAAIFGDLVESFFKRNFNIKDSSKTIPGIGGVLDLIDSICYTAPIGFLIYILCQ